MLNALAANFRSSCASSVGKEATRCKFVILFVLFSGREIIIREVFEGTAMLGKIDSSNWSQFGTCISRSQDPIRKLIERPNEMIKEKARDLS